jgi:N-formylglutamate deformylase
VNSPVYTLTQGSIPLLVSFPHSGPLLPEPYAGSMTAAARLVADTDWHLPALYDFVTAMGASTVHANYSRYIIDMNRPATGESLYPGQTTTSLCPTETFRGEPLYPAGGEPDDAEVADRVEKFWKPFHGALQAELDRLKAVHGQVLLWEAHSIASVLPRLFEGQLPDLNIGTFGGASCAPSVQEAVVSVAEASPFTSVVNGRFKGGHITRHFGQPGNGVHAVQMEMTQLLYMDENAPFGYLPDVAAKVKPTLQAMISAAVDALP